jgi:hypothetical protein
MLEQMERALYAEDPKFASALEGNGLRVFTRRRVYLSVLGVVCGIGLLVGAMVVKQAWLGVVGFLVMLVCAVLAVSGWRRAVRPLDQQQPQAVPGHVGRRFGAKRRQQPRRGTMMERIEERWQRRRDEQGQ